MNEQQKSILSPLDNRYAMKITDVREHFDVVTFTKYKLFVECEYLKFLCGIINVGYDADAINSIHHNFNRGELNKVFEYEKQTNHDVQALVEYLKDNVATNLRQWVHFGLTSQDINSPAMVMTYKHFNSKILWRELHAFQKLLDEMRESNLHTIMLTFTHGQPATPSSFAKQMMVYNSKLTDITDDLFTEYTYKTKVGGSNGDLSGLKFCFPEHNWDHLMDIFAMEHLLLARNRHTTQIDNYINYFKLFQIYERLCFLLINFSQDMWMYIHNDYLTLCVIPGEVGSSAMPHKVNPIHFENAEGNLKIAASLFHTIGSSICLSRLQRDLTDSTMLRNVGVACGHLVLALRNIIVGFKRIRVNDKVVANDLNKHSSVMMEFIQLRLRQWGVQKGYNLCKEFSRGHTSFDARKFIAFLETNDVKLSDIQKNTLFPEYTHLLM